MAVCAVGAFMLTNACSSEAGPAGNEPSRSDGQVVDALDLYSFDSLAEMTATSDAVVEATVVATGPGRTVGPEESSIQFHEATLRIDQVIVGKLKHDPVLLEEDGAYEESADGDHGLYFLTYKGGDEVPFYRLVSSAGRFLEAQDGTLVASNDETAWAATLERATVSTLIDEVREAGKDIEAGIVKPAAPDFGPGSSNESAEA